MVLKMSLEKGMVEMTEPANGSKPSWKEVLELVKTEVGDMSASLKEVFTLQNNENVRLLKAVHTRLDTYNNESVSYRALNDKEHNDIIKGNSDEHEIINQKVDKMQSSVWIAVVSFFGTAGLGILAKIMGWL